LICSQDLHAQIF